MVVSVASCGRPVSLRTLFSCWLSRSLPSMLVSTVLCPSSSPSDGPITSTGLKVKQTILVTVQILQNNFGVISKVSISNNHSHVTNVMLTKQ